MNTFILRSRFSILYVLYVLVVSICSKDIIALYDIGYN